ncbi:hypothetical protein [Corynebacterium sp. AOP12-C2-36]|uniref:hypothetical protein n=1 Tax=Corynebacterium sp. AOP12-C2-36 TaxID=3457723 RepID=UPI004033B276
MTDPNLPHNPGQGAYRPTGNDNPTELIRPVSTVRPADLPHQPAPPRVSAAYGQPEAEPSGHPAGDADQPRLIAGRFDSNALVKNLAVLSVIAGVITFAVVLATLELVTRFTDSAETGGVVYCVAAGMVTALIVAGAGALYVPVVGTGSEGLYSAAIGALTVAAFVLYGVLAGLLDGQWEVTVTMMAILCAGALAYAAPKRVDAVADTTARAQAERSNMVGAYRR